MVVSDLDAAAAKETSEQIISAGGKASFYSVNVANQVEVEKMFADIVKEYKKIDIVVNNAGINRDAMLHKMEKKQWDDVIAVN